MKKITFLLLHLNYGGLEKQTVTLINELAKTKEYKIEVISVYNMLKGKSFYKLDKSVDVKFLADFGPNHKAFYYALKHFRLIKLLKESFFMIKCGIYKNFVLKKYIKKLDTDIIISSRIEFSKLIKRRDTLNISQEHSYINSKKYINKVRKNFKNIDKIIVMTNKAKEEYQKWLKNSNSNAKVFVIPNMLEETNINNFAKFKNKTIISVGRLEKEKDFLTLLDVFKIINDKYSDVKLKIVGEGLQRKEIEEKIYNLKLKDSVSLTGRVSSQKVQEEMSTSSVFVLTSLCESFSLVLCEAMEIGLPCVSFNIDVGPKEIIQNGINGYLINNRNIENMAKCIENLLTDEDEWNKISQNSIKSVKKYYSTNVVNEWKKLFH